MFFAWQIEPIIAKTLLRCLERSSKGAFIGLLEMQQATLSSFFSADGRKGGRQRDEARGNIKLEEDSGDATNLTYSSTAFCKNSLADNVSPEKGRMTSYKMSTKMENVSAESSGELGCSSHMQTNSEMVDVNGYNPSKQNYSPKDDACWRPGQSTPYMALALTLMVIENTPSRLEIIRILCNLFRSIICLSPQDLLPCIYLCLNQLGPTYEGLELGISDATLQKAVAQCTGRSVDVIKAELGTKGDLGIVAEGSRNKQRTIFSSRPLTISGLFSNSFFSADGRKGGRQRDEARGNIKLEEDSGDATNLTYSSTAFCKNSLADNVSPEKGRMTSYKMSTKMENVSAGSSGELGCSSHVQTIVLHCFHCFSMFPSLHDRCVCAEIRRWLMLTGIIQASKTIHQRMTPVGDPDSRTVTQMRFITSIQLVCCRTPYMALALTLMVIENTPSRLEIIRILCNLFRSIICLSPQDLLPCIYLCLNQLGPTYEGLELGISDATLQKAVAQCTGRSVDVIKAELGTKGDLGIVAEGSRNKQRTIFSSRPLTISGLFSKLKSIAKQTGSNVGARSFLVVVNFCKLLKSMNKKLEITKGLISVCQGCEARFVVRCLGGKMRIGLAEQSLLISLAHAFTFSELDAQGNKMPKGDALKLLLGENALKLKSAFW
ncbi:hypothetical protein M513_13604 [Trichuris suis]|uniref:DNA ligase ATP-dependent N-terminal domain-containing protein n=1 Tax=Trichuris suis TaxID=68888 RepID=A0A085LKM2_9BILA|nr:hypothetical protein M513_13604 [Trichuris suis]